MLLEHPDFLKSSMLHLCLSTQASLRSQGPRAKLLLTPDRTEASLLTMQVFQSPLTTF